MSAQFHPLLESAQAAFERQQWSIAAQFYDVVLSQQPGSLPARIGRARCAMLQAEPNVAVRHLEDAAELAPENAAVARSLGVALLAQGSLEAALAAFLRARTLAPQEALTRLHLGQALERLARRPAAAQAYYRGLLLAQGRGQWLDRASTPPHLQAAVLHAMNVVDQERRQLLEGLLAPWRERHGSDALARVQRCLEGHLKTVQLLSADAPQRPRFLYFPELPTPRYFDPALVPWLARLQAATPVVRAEAQSVLGENGALQPFLKFDSPEQVGSYLGGGDTPPAWDAFFFYRDGVAVPANQQRCPQTSALLESLPLVRIREHAPEICFSVLAPGTHILPHTGVTNIRVVVHLPLVVPADCALEVGGEVHAWREGEPVVFDDTYEHHAWNRSDDRRVVLLMDAWNPYLTEVEREAMAALIAGIGDFNREV